MKCSYLELNCLLRIYIAHNTYIKIMDVDVHGKTDQAASYIHT